MMSVVEAVEFCARVFQTVDGWRCKEELVDINDILLADTDSYILGALQLQLDRKAQLQAIKRVGGAKPTWRSLTVEG